MQNQTLKTGQETELGNGLENITKKQDWSQEQCTHMLQIPKADVQILEQDPQGMGSIYFSLENQINLVQASQKPGNTIKIHPKEGFCSVPSS